MKNNLILNGQLVAILLVVAFLYSFSSQRNNNRIVLQNQAIFMDYKYPFLTQESVNNLLIESSKGLRTIEKVKLNLFNIEKTVNKHSMIDNSQVYMCVDGKLETIVKQKTPIARVFNQNLSFYIDYKGSTMPLSSNYSARVPVVFGAVKNKYSTKIVELLKMIFEDDFLKKNIIGLKILPNGNVIMKNRDYAFEIFMGRTINMDRKLNNYKAFFQKAVQTTDVSLYKKVNLEFTSQVICTK
jgi:cell division protein FtsQ